MYLKTVHFNNWVDKKDVIRIEFRDGLQSSGEHVGLRGERDRSVKLFWLNEVVKLHGIGHVDIAENRFVTVSSAVSMRRRPQPFLAVCIWTSTALRWTEKWCVCLGSHHVQRLQRGRELGDNNRSPLSASVCVGLRVWWSSPTSATSAADGGGVSQLE